MSSNDMANLLQTGKVVTLKNLNSIPDLNGALGKVVSTKRTKDSRGVERFPIKIIKTSSSAVANHIDKQIAVKGENLDVKYRVSFEDTDDD